MNHTWRVYSPRDLAEAVRGARSSRGFDQGELAERLGVGRMTVSRLERGDPGVSVATAVRALSECGYSIVVVPKFSRVEVLDGA